MTRRELIDLCLRFPDSYEDYPFEGVAGAGNSSAWAVIRHRTNRKSFALIFERDGLSVNLKCESMRADFLRSALPGVAPAYHMNKEHWNTVKVDLVSPEALEDMLRHSYALTVPKRRTRKTDK